MSDYSFAYTQASEELQRRLRPFLYAIIAIIIVMVAALYLLHITEDRLFLLAIVVIGLGFGSWKRRVWRQLEVKYGLRDG